MDIISKCAATTRSSWALSSWGMLPFVQSGLSQAYSFFVHTPQLRRKNLSSYQSPEFLRISLVDLALDAKCFAVAYGGTLQEVLQSAPEPPSQRAIDHAVQSLVFINAFDEHQNLTRLGSRFCCSCSSFQENICQFFLLNHNLESLSLLAWQCDVSILS
jgi:hypothetical protein